MLARGATRNNQSGGIWRGGEQKTKVGAGHGVRVGDGVARQSWHGVGVGSMLRGEPQETTRAEGTMERERNKRVEGMMEREKQVINWSEWDV